MSQQVTKQKNVWTAERPLVHPCISHTISPTLGQLPNTGCKYESLRKNSVTLPWVSKNAETMCVPINSFKITPIFWEKSNICMIWNTTEHTGLKSEKNYKFICPNFPLLLLVRYFKNQSKLTQHKNQVLFLVLKVFFRNKTQSITCSHVNTFIIFFFLSPSPTIFPT